MFAAAALSLAACTKDVAPTTPDAPVFGKNAAYAQVAIKMAGAGTRADVGYTAGTKEESLINSLSIVLFDKNGNNVGFGSHFEFDKPEEGSTGWDNSENVEHGYNTANNNPIVRITLTPGDAKPAKLYAFVNTDAEFDTEDDLLEATTNALTADGFVMTNSGYYN